MLLPARERELIEVAKVKTKHLSPYDFKFEVRAVARDIPEYFLEIRTFPEVRGEANGQAIEINTLGRWLFGTPGYAGHYRQRIEGDTVVILVPPVDEAVELIKKALHILSAMGKIELLEEK